MKREAIVAAVESYVREWAGHNATVTRVERYRTYANKNEAIVQVQEGDGAWALRVREEEVTANCGCVYHAEEGQRCPHDSTRIIVVDDSLPADTRPTEKAL
jgi:hypothetical protein